MNAASTLPSRTSFSAAGASLASVIFTPSCCSYICACSPTPTIAIVGVPDSFCTSATIPEMMAASTPRIITAAVTRKYGLRMAVVLSRFDTSHAAWRLPTSTNSETSPVSGSSSGSGVSSASSKGTSSRPSVAPDSSDSFFAVAVDPFDAPVAVASSSDSASSAVVSSSITSSSTGTPRSSMPSPAVPLDTSGSGDSSFAPLSLRAITEPPCTARPVSGGHFRSSSHSSARPRQRRLSSHRRR